MLASNSCPVTDPLPEFPSFELNPGEVIEAEATEQNVQVGQAPVTAAPGVTLFLNPDGMDHQVLSWGEGVENPMFSLVVEVGVGPATLAGVDQHHLTGCFLIGEKEEMLLVAGEEPILPSRV